MTDILFPPGRMVQGDLYASQKKDRNDPNSRDEYFFAVAIPKNTGETHWADTSWGSQIQQIAQAGFTKGEHARRDFAWKIVDGDSTEIDKSGKSPSQKEGFPGNWVVRFSSGFPPTVLNADGTQQLLQKDFVKAGDYIQVFGNVAPNGSAQSPGVYINHNAVAFVGHGERIVNERDYSAVGFGQATKPAGAMDAPPAGNFNPAPMPTPAAPAPVAPVPTPAAPVPAPEPAAPVPAPEPAVLAPPPARKMTDKANGITYEQYVASGWSDEQLIQHGMMEA